MQNKTGEKSIKDFVYEFHRNMTDNDIILAYEGEVTQEITLAFTNLTQRNLEESESNIPLKKRVYHVMVECLQNIGKHSDDAKSGEPIVPGQGLFMVSRNDSGYAITTGNIVSSAKTGIIQKLLDEINALNRDQIKELYKKKIVENKLSEKGGAGLGFIDIVKKTGNPIKYHFIEVSDRSSFFILRSEIFK